MTLPTYRSTEILYTIILRDPDARTLLQRWVATSRHIQARVDEHRLHVHDQHTLNTFIITWTGGWDNILIWDTYLRRHINF